MSSNEQAKASKERTREIKVWVRAKAENLLTGKSEFGFKVYSKNPHLMDETFEATLLIKEPEKTVPVTRDELYALWGCRWKDFEAHVSQLFGSEI